MKIEILNRKQKEILLYLGKYKFLDYAQMIRLGIDKYKSNIAKEIKGLRDSRQPLVAKIPHSFSEKAVYYLLKLGAETLLEIEQFNDDTLIHFPKRRITRNTQDAVHRYLLIDIQISLELASVGKCEMVVPTNFMTIKKRIEFYSFLKKKTYFFQH